MLNGNVFYHGIIRKVIVGFGQLFSNIYIDRKEGDSVVGLTAQRLHVPLAYAPKEKWIVRIEQDPTLDKHTYTTLPRISFEITGYSYDPQRRLNKMNKVMCNNTTSSTSSFTPVPYNLDMSLYVLTKTQEDALQIIEQILPTFGPEYTLSIVTVPDLNVVQDVPIILNGVSVDDQYDGDFETRRFVIHTLNFTAKLNLFGYVSSSKPIYHVEANVATRQDMSGTQTYRADGDPMTYQIINERWLDEF